jgi:hypothetical protein
VDRVRGSRAGRGAITCSCRPPLNPVVLLMLVLVLPAAAPVESVPALAGPPDEAPVVALPVRVSGPTPFRDGCEGSPLRSRVYRGSAVEPILAVDPRDPQHLVGAWLQDRIATSAASAVLTGASRDGGQTWTPSSPRFTRCSGGTAANGGDYPRVADPWLAIAPNGEVYLVALALNAFAGPETVGAIVVSKSADGGLTWSDAVTLTRDSIATGFNDKPTITADPFDANYVYAVWDRDFLASQTASGLVEAPLLFSRTTDGGRTWEPPRVIYAAPGARTIGPIVVVLPNGDLVNVFGRGLPSGAGELRYDVALVRSSDRGATWSEPVSASDMVLAPLQDPYSTFRLQPDPSLAFIPTVAADRRSGRLHVAWQDGRFGEGEHTYIAYTTSADGGRTWSPPVRVNKTTGDVPAFVPTIAVLEDGTVGVSYYDLRSATPTEFTILTDAWLVSCRADCAEESAWRETHVAGPFDLARAPYGRGFFVGDYQGMAGTASGFHLFYIVTNPADAPSITDVNFVTVTLR